MTPAHCNRLLGLALVCAGQVWLAAGLARAAAIERVPRSPASAVAPHPLTPPPPGVLPPLGAARSPIAFFRELLAMNAAERKQALTNRAPESQERILAKVREYQSLNADERELRLQVTELQWYLVPLMSGAATNRAAQLALIPIAQRKRVEDRLAEWDKLGAPEQQKLLENQATIRYFTELENLTPEQRRTMLGSIPPERRALLEKGIDRWNQMSSEQRQATLSRFNQFFELTPEEKEKALSTISGAERRQIEKTLRAFGSLSPEQRAACIESFAKFASLDVAEREQFLKNVERWKAMSPAERQSWRDVVRNIPRLLPPQPPPLPPPLVPKGPSSKILVTNGN